MKNEIKSILTILVFATLFFGNPALLIAAKSPEISGLFNIGMFICLMIVQPDDNRESF